MALGIGMIKTGLQGMGGSVIRSGVRSLARGRVLATALRGADPAMAAAARGMLAGSAMRGALQGAALMGGLNAGRQIGSNLWNDRSAMSGVGGAAFRGAVAGGIGGAGVGMARGIGGRSSAAWRGFLTDKAVAPNVGTIAREMRDMRLDPNQFMGGMRGRASAGLSQVMANPQVQNARTYVGLGAMRADWRLRGGRIKRDLAEIMK